jgi:hypothetical protein
MKPCSYVGALALTLLVGCGKVINDDGGIADSGSSGASVASCQPYCLGTYDVEQCVASCQCTDECPCLEDCLKQNKECSSDNEMIFAIVSADVWSDVQVRRVAQQPLSEIRVR